MGHFFPLAVSQRLGIQKIENRQLKSLKPYSNLEIPCSWRPSVEYWNGQLSIYISSATISHWRDYEPLTISPTKRFESFASCNKAGVHSCLYLKPLLSGITIKDLAQYGEIMQLYSVPAIVGERFSTDHQQDTSPISKTLFVVYDDESVVLREKLSAYGQVFSKSEDALAYLRKLR